MNNKHAKHAKHTQDNEQNADENAKYNTDIINQLVALNIGTRSEIIDAMQHVVNVNDINEIADYLFTNNNMKIMDEVKQITTTELEKKLNNINNVKNINNIPDISKIQKKDKQILIKICQNILEHPKENKYRDIDSNELSHKFNSVQRCIDLLFSVGFKNYGNRLILYSNDIGKVKELHHLLTTQHVDTPNDMLPKIIELMKSGFSANDAELAVAMSLNSDQNIDTVTFTQNDTKNDDKDDEKDRYHATLISMGFEKAASMKALKLAHFDLNVAVQYLTNNTFEQIESSDPECEGGIDSMKHCKHLLLIKKILTKYTSSNDDINVDMNHMISILNSFHHLLYKHDSNKEFQDIYNILGKCNILKCNKFRRNRRDRNPEQKSNNDEKEKFKNDIMDKIHCNFLHSFDEKYDALPEFVRNRNESHNKFNNYNYDVFNFGDRYFYWDLDRYKKIIDFEDSVITNVYENCMIYPKYKSLKEELISNCIARLNVAQWNNEYNKALAHKQSYYGRQRIADPEATTPYREGAPMRDGRIYDIEQGSEILVNHLLSVIVYCSYDTLSFEFSKTYRTLEKDDFSDNDWIQYVKENKFFFAGKAIDFSVDTNDMSIAGNESIPSMKGRHSKFYHLAKNLNELIHVYSPQVMYAGRYTVDHQVMYAGRYKVYHGVNKKVRFTGMNDGIFQPFSTTRAIEVALSFSGNDGLILEILPCIWSRCFDCDWISDFSNEKEVLFINAVGSFRFQDIINVSNGYYYDEYVKALGIIDSACWGIAFQPNAEVIKNCVTKEIVDVKTRSDLELVGAKPIDPSLKELTLQLIHHELHRYQPEKHKKMENIDCYMDETLHYMCFWKNVVIIDWELMITEIIEKNIYLSDGGYNGYLFLKPFFFTKDSEIIDLDFICSLFPNARCIKLANCPQLTEDWFIHIVAFLLCIDTQRKHQRFVGLILRCQDDPSLLANRYAKVIQSYYKDGWRLDVTRKKTYWQISFYIPDSISKSFYVQGLQSKV